MSQYEAAVDAFVKAVMTSDEETRNEELSTAVTEDVVFFGPEPHEAFESRHQLSDYVAQVSQALPPGTTVLRTTPVDDHHGQVRWGMVFRLPDGTDAYRFEGFGEGQEGRLRRIVTFDVGQE